MLRLCEDIMICNSSSYKNQAEILLLQSNQELAPAKSHHNAISEEVITQKHAERQRLLPSEEIMNIARRSSGSGSFHSFQAGRLPAGFPKGLMCLG